jgi:ATP-dependent DNA helicase RecG
MISETQTVEFKSSWRDEWLKWVCGFANAHGGTLEVGKDDDGTVVGVKDSHRLMEEIPNKLVSLMAIVADIDLRSQDGHDYIVIKVPSYPNPISYHGRYFIRTGASNHELTGNALQEFLLRRVGKSWDTVPLPGIQTADLDQSALSEFRRKALASKRLSQADLDIDDDTLIHGLRLREGEYLRRSAILLFHSDPEKWVVGAYAKIGAFASGSELLYQNEVHGPLIGMPDRILDLLFTKYLRAIISYQDIQRVETFPVPWDACREAVLNAVVHKDYSMGVPIQIKVLPDKLMIGNVGRLPEGWGVDDLTSLHTSVPHNPDLAGVFFRSGQIEAWGRGIEKIEEACAEAGAPAPVFKVTGPTIDVMFPFAATMPPPGGAVGGNRGGNQDEEPSEDDLIGLILTAIARKPTATQAELVAATGVTQRTLQRTVRRLRESGVLQRVGSTRSGYWQIIEHE